MSNRHKKGYYCFECKKLAFFGHDELYRKRNITCPSCGSYAMSPSKGAKKQEKNVQNMREEAAWLKRNRV